MKTTYSLLDLMMASPTEPTPRIKRTYQLTRMWSGLAAIERAPQPTTDDWRVCSDAVNLMETLVLEMRLCDDGRGLLNDAVTALAMAGRRHQAGGHIRLDAEGIQAVRAVLEDYATMLETLSHRTMLKCHQLTERRLQAILKGKRKAHDVEIMDLRGVM